MPTLYHFNIDGQTVDLDLRPAIKAGETDTSLLADASSEALRYNAERHTNTITGEQLGSILRLSYLKDISNTTPVDHALLVYQRNSDCTGRCRGEDDTWVQWSPLDNATDELRYTMGFDSTGAPQSLAPPTDTTKHYQMTWDGTKAGWRTPTEAATVPVDSDGYAYQVFLDPTTRELVYVRRQV